MDKNYQPKTIEKSALSKWQQNNLGKPSGKNDSFCIMLPPPNITGSLHMGHGFQLTLMDILTRQQRMAGKNTLWQPGTDHAGIATQMVVTKQLKAKKIDQHDLSREEFIDHIWQWKKQSGSEIEKQIARMGASVDWDKKKFTLDESLSAAVKKVFIDLHQQNLIYKAERLTNWDCKLQTAVSDLEVCHTTKQGSLWHINYPIKGSNEFITIATTRPETILGDSAVAINPKDSRYQHLIGKTVIVPLSNREVPIIADDSVDIEFGTGCLKITPAHDFNDNIIGKKHNLPMHNILNLDGTLNEFAPKKYQNIDRLIARKMIIKDLQQQGLLIKTEPYEITLPLGDRSGTIIEPILTKQWFVKMKQLAKPAIEQVKLEKIKFVPKNWENTYFNWLEDIQDWCISRQLVWGHRIPAWYDEQGNIYVGESLEKVQSKYNLDKELKLTQDEDVLDTWFSSALWPFATLGWPNNSQDFATYFPTQVLVTGFDIIFFWVARMIMMSLHFTNKIPFETIYITGLIRDQNGHKMSKSKGNVIDPIDLIDGISLKDLISKRTSGLMQPEMAEQIKKNTIKEYPHGIEAAGTDAVRFTFCALASTGRDIRFDSQRLIGYRNFCNKLWNACRYLQQSLVDEQYSIPATQQPQHFINQWITNELVEIIQQTNQHLDNYRFDLLAKCLYEFTWYQYCDWYLEWSKTLLESSNSNQLKQETQHTLLNIMSHLLRLLHPIIPFITDALWSSSKIWQFNYGKDISQAKWPLATDFTTNKKATQQVDLLKSVISAIRNIRSELGISPNKLIDVNLITTNLNIKNQLIEQNDLLLKLAKITNISWNKADNANNSAVAVVNDLTISVPLAGLIDTEIEITRINKTIEKIEKQLYSLEQRLNNQSYIAKAPPHLIEKAQLEHQQLIDQQQQLKQKITQLELINQEANND